MLTCVTIEVGQESKTEALQEATTSDPTLPSSLPELPKFLVLKPRVCWVLGPGFLLKDSSWNLAFTAQPPHGQAMSPVIPLAMGIVTEGCQEAGPTASLGSKPWAVVEGRRHLLSSKSHQPWHRPPKQFHIYPSLSPLLICDFISTGPLPSKLTGFRL